MHVFHSNNNTRVDLVPVESLVSFDFVDNSIFDDL